MIPEQTPGYYRYEGHGDNGSEQTPVRDHLLTSETVSTGGRRDPIGFARFWDNPEHEW